MNTFKIIKGNSFVLHIALQKIYVSKDTQMPKGYDISRINGLSVSLVSMFGSETPLDINDHVTTTDNDIQVSFPSNMDEGIYGITIKGRYSNQDFCCTEEKLFRIVQNNGRSYIPLGVVEGEIGGMFKTQYWIELGKPEINVEFLASPDMIVYDGNAHNVSLSWTILEDGSEASPTKISLTHNGETTDYPAEQKEVTMLLTELGAYHYKLEIEIYGITYVLEKDVVVRKIAYYGASHTTNPASLDLTTLNDDLSTLAGHRVNVQTTDTDDTIWFVSEVPLRFVQANLELELTEAVVDGVYYYNTVPLEAGDNEFLISAK